MEERDSSVVARARDGDRDAFRALVDLLIEAENSTRVDAALYWKAYALDKLSQSADALAAVQRASAGSGASARRDGRA